MSEEWDTYTSHSGMTCHFRKTGISREPAIVALHPWFGCWDFWLSVAERYPERDWFLVDLYSASAGIAVDVGAFDQLAAAVVELVGELTDRPVVLMGNSTGGLLSQTIAFGELLSLSALVLVGTGASAEGIPTPFRTLLGRWTSADPEPEPKLTRQVVRSLLAVEPAAETLHRYEQAVLTADYAFMRSVLLDLFGRDVTTSLADIRVPTLVVRGAQDAARTTDHVRILCEHIPRASSVEIPDAGHSPMVDQPVAFEAALRGFLDSVSPA